MILGVLTWVFHLRLLRLLEDTQIWTKLATSEIPNRPSKRFGHSMQKVNNDMVILFGGDDGDYDNSPTNYKTKLFGDLWVLSTRYSILQRSDS
jgi:hypothetical protein